MSGGREREREWSMERRELERRGQKQRDSGGEGDRATGKGGETRVAWIKCHGETKSA